MRLGGFVKKTRSPEEWARANLEMGYSAVNFPVDYTASTQVIDSYKRAAEESDLVICEIGVWNNTLERDPVKREENICRAVHQLELIAAIDRPGFGVHLDMVNVINCPTLYYRNGEVIREWFRKLDGHILACHAKDIILSGRLTVHLDECRPGTGALDYRAYLECMSKLPERTCLMLEHMTEKSDYIAAARYIKGVAAEIGVTI